MEKVELEKYFDAKKARLEKDFERYSGGKRVSVHKIGSVYYGYGSELAVLRIYAKYNSNGAAHNKKVRVGYSENLSVWYVSVDMEL